MSRVVYYNNKNCKLRKRINTSFNLESDAGGREAIQNTWGELREKLLNREIDYEDLDKIKDTSFIGVLNKLLEYDYIKELVTVDLKYFAKSKIFLRAAIVNEKEVVTKERFIPRCDKMKSPNRFSPIGVEWLYLGFDRYLLDAKKCCLAEVRAEEGSNVKFCEFRHNGDVHRVIDLTIMDNKNWDEICHKTAREAEKMATSFAFEVYCKLLSEEIFLPVNSEDKGQVYAPFHCLAQYFQSLKFDGIIYKSTVSKAGKNIVMFDKNSFFPIKIF